MGCASTRSAGTDRPCITHPPDAVTNHASAHAPVRCAASLSDTRAARDVDVDPPDEHVVVIAAAGPMTWGRPPPPAGGGGGWGTGGGRPVAGPPPLKPFVEIPAGVNLHPPPPPPPQGVDLMLVRRTRTRRASCRRRRTGRDRERNRTPCSRIERSFAAAGGLIPAPRQCVEEPDYDEDKNPTQRHAARLGVVG